MRYRMVPRVSAVYSDPEPYTGHVCGNCRQPESNKGVESCPNNRRHPDGCDAACSICREEAWWADYDAQKNRERSR